MPRPSLPRRVGPAVSATLVGVLAALPASAFTTRQHTAAARNAYQRTCARDLISEADAVHYINDPDCRGNDCELHDITDVNTNDVLRGGEEDRSLVWACRNWDHFLVDNIMNQDTLRNGCGFGQLGVPATVEFCSGQTKTIEDVCQWLPMETALVPNQIPLHRALGFRLREQRSAPRPVGVRRDRGLHCHRNQLATTGSTSASPCTRTTRTTSRWRSGSAPACRWCRRPWEPSAGEAWFCVAFGPLTERHYR